MPLASFNASPSPPDLTPTPTLFSRLIRARDSTTLVRVLSTLASSPLTIARLLTTHDCDGHTALHWLSFDPRPHLTAALLVYVRHSLASAAVDVDVPSRAAEQRGQTPLHWALYQGHLPLVRGLLALGASPHVADARGYNAAVHAAQYGRIDVLHILLASVDGRRRGGVGGSTGAPGGGGGESGTSGNVMMMGSDGTSISSSSSNRGSITSELASLVRSKDHTGNSLVQWASYYNHAPMVRYLTLLYGNGSSPAVSGIDAHADGAPQAVIDVDECDDSGSNALHRAAIADAYLVVDALLRSGARVDIPDARGMTVQRLLAQKKYSRTRSAVVYRMHLNNNAISGRAVSYFPFTSSGSSSSSNGMGIAKSEDDGVDETEVEDVDVDIDVEDQQGNSKKKNYAQTKRLQRVPQQPQQQQQRRYQQQQQQQQQRTTDLGRRRLMYLLRRYGLVMIYYAMLVATCVMYVSRVALRGDMVVVATAGYHAVMMVCALTAGACHLRTLFGDPGDTACMTVAQFVHYLDSLLLLPSDSPSSSQSAQKDSKSSISNNNTVDVNLQLLPSRFCFTCLAPRPPRSHHSRLRDRCVRRFDHDCPWVANAVGLYTHRALVALVVATVMGQTLFLLAVYRLYAVRLRAVAFWTDPPLVAVVFVNIAALVFCAFLLASQVRLIVRGATTYESIMKARRAKTARVQRPGCNGSTATSSCCHQRKGQAGHGSRCNNNTNSDNDNVHNNNNENNNKSSSTITSTTTTTTNNNSKNTITHKQSVCDNRNSGNDHDDTVHHQHDTAHTAASNGNSDPDLDSLPEYNFGACTNVIAFITMTGPGTHVARVPRTPYGIFTALLHGVCGPQQDFVHNHDHDDDVQLLNPNDERGRHAAISSVTKNRHASVAIDVDAASASSNGAAM